MAENGTSKEYKLNVSITDPNPIEIELNNEKYTLVKTNKKLVKPEGYEESTININDFDYNAYKLDNRFVICYAMDMNNGQYNYYKYDIIDKTFQYYEIFKEDRKINYYFITTIVLGGLLSISIFFNIYFIIKRKKFK